MTERLTKTFAALRAQNRSAFVPYIMGGDPDLNTSWELLDGLAKNGANVIELGFPFTDPTADGPAIQAAGQRALAGGATLDDILDLARRFRDAHADVPLILMGYANPVHRRGFEAFAAAAAEAGVDGAIIVDMPPEEDAPLRAAFAPHHLSVVRLATPTADETRLNRIVEHASGMVYYVSVKGVTGAAAAAQDVIAANLARIRTHTDLPVAVGFGVRTRTQAALIAGVADAVVVGSALVETAADAGVEAALRLAKDLSAAVRAGRAEAGAA